MLEIRKKVKVSGFPLVLFLVACFPPSHINLFCFKFRLPNNGFVCDTIFHLLLVCISCIHTFLCLFHFFQFLPNFFLATKTLKKTFSQKYFFHKNKLKEETMKNKYNCVYRNVLLICC